MITTAAQRAPVVPPSPPSTPRLRLAPTRASQAVLDGGWWPRSRDPVAELPGLVLALTARYGPIRQLMLNAGAWERCFHRLVVGPRTVRLGWFTTLDPALLIATTDARDQLDLLVVAASTPTALAQRAMTMAADPTNTLRAPDILTAAVATPTPPPAAAPRTDDDPRTAWDNEGGHLADPLRGTAPWG